jgi:membrane-associated protease RseP (regulator of RpoE activity)
MVNMNMAIGITVLVIYALVLLLLNRFNILERMNIEAFLGFILMWRTRRGKRFINRLAKPKRFWEFWGNMGIVLVGLAGMASYLLLLWEAFIIVRIPPDAAPGPELLIGIPGINPLIPVGYGILALALAIIWHEFSHGILTRVAKVRIRSLGVIAVIIPIGAFVEPDEDKLKKIPKLKKARVYAAGPMANIIMAFICALVFSFGFMGSVEPIEDGMVVTHVTKDYPAHEAGLEPWMLITGISSINFTVDELVTQSDFDNAMARTKAGELVNITYYFKGHTQHVQVELESKYDYYLEYYTGLSDEYLKSIKGVGFLGINTQSLRVDIIESQARPFRTSDTILEVFGEGLMYVSLPLFKMSPMPDELSSLMVVKGPLGVLPENSFWLLANLFYWLFWLNFMVGATNALPAKPLDGGHMFRDGVWKVIRRMRPKMKTKRADKLADRISLAISFSVLFLILWLPAGPYVAAGFRNLLGLG